MPAMFYVLVFLAVILAIEGVMIMTRSGNADPRRVRDRLKALAPTQGGVAQPDGSVMRKSEQRGWFGRVMQGVPNGSSLDVLLYRAGMPTTTVRFMLFTVLLGALGYVTLTLLADPVRGSLGVLAGFVPYFVVRSMANKRTRRFEEQLPEGLELLTRSLRAGHGLGSGFHLVGEEMEDPIGTEFGLVAEEVRFGLDMRDALDNLTRRVQNDDLPYFTTAVLIQRQTGGNLAELLDKLSALLRERAQFYGKVRAMTAQGRGAATFLACWLPFISAVVWFTSPNYLQPLFENAWGHAVIAAAIAMDIFGYWIALRIADVQA
jgi:tight adherence protein B